MKYIFLHGWSFSKDIWKDFYKLENSLFIDLPFHNEKEYYKKKDILKNFALELSDLIDSFNEGITVIGWSLGASLSILTALNKPNNLKKLVLVGFSPKFKDEELGHSPKGIKAFMLQLRKDFENTVYQFRKTAVDNEFKNVSLPLKDGGIAILKEFIELDLTESLKYIDIETILIAGKDDRIINYRGSVFANKELRNSYLILTKDHHAPFLNKPELILENL